jgi:glucuronate isomerase
VKWIVLLTQVVELVLKLVQLLAAKKKEAEVEKLDENPGEWFNDHFNGVSKPDANTSEQTETAKFDDSAERRNVSEQS